MIIYPAIDLFAAEAVRLHKGDYNKKTVYSADPVGVALDFKAQGASHIHVVDLEGAADGTTPNLDLICRIKERSGLFCEVGGGIRSMDVIDKYISCGIDRIILGTAAVTDGALLRAAVEKYAGRIAVGVDIKDGFVAIKGWRESSGLEAFAFCDEMQRAGISTMICTDISKDGAMSGTNTELYGRLAERLSVNIIASGGVSSLDDVRALSALGIHGAIIGKAYYTGAVSIKEALCAAKNN